MRTNVRERLTISKQAAQKSVAGKFNLRKLKEVEFRKQYQIKVSNMCAVLQNLNDGEDINRA